MDAAEECEKMQPDVWVFFIGHIPPWRVWKSASALQMEGRWPIKLKDHPDSACIGITDFVILTRSKR
eukprot:scaffold170201_cov22-Tisochrysis_lutea.AAC.1